MGIIVMMYMKQNFIHDDNMIIMKLISIQIYDDADEEDDDEYLQAQYFHINVSQQCCLIIFIFIQI